MDIVVQYFTPCITFIQALQVKIVTFIIDSPKHAQHRKNNQFFIVNEI